MRSTKAFNGRLQWLWVWGVLALACCRTCVGEDDFYVGSPIELGLVGAITEPNVPYGVRVPVRIQLSTEGEAFAYRKDNQYRVALRIPEGAIPRGTLWLLSETGETLQEYKFDGLKHSTKSSQKDFFIAKSTYYQTLDESLVAGDFFFRRQAQRIRNDAGAESQEPVKQRYPWVQDTDLLSPFRQGFALAKQVDPETPWAREQKPFRLFKREEVNIPIDSIPRPTFNLKLDDARRKAADLHPDLDPLSHCVPSDQYLIVIRSLQSWNGMQREINRLNPFNGNVGFLNSYQGGTIYSERMLLQKYEEQLSLSLADLQKSPESKSVKSFAFTSSDPHVDLGSDVATLFETDDAVALFEFLRKTFRERATNEVATKIEEIVIEDVKLLQLVSQTNSRQSYLAKLDQGVLVTNSPHQAKRIIRVSQRKNLSLAESPEYRVLRDRYSIHAPDEAAFLFAPSEAYLAWTSPEIRIGQSRRIRAAAAMLRVQSDHIDEWGNKTAIGKKWPAPFFVPNMSDVSAVEDGVFSEVYGSLRHMTPIAHLDMQQVTPAEVESYTLWHSRAKPWLDDLNPFAAQIRRTDTELNVDASGLPLNSTVFLSSKKLKPFPRESTDQHPEALLHFVSSVEAFDPVKALEATEVYLDESDFWQQFVEQSEIDEYFKTNLQKLPIAIRLHFGDAAAPEKLLATIRGLVGTMISPDSDETKFAGQSYLSVTLQLRILPGFPEELTVYRAILGKSLLFTLDEKVMQDALQRYSDRLVGKVIDKNQREWLGSTASFQANKNCVDALQILSRQVTQAALRQESWKNLPILNEWKRRFPDCDPVEFHQRIWTESLTCPGGGKYEWDEVQQTMRSDKFGSPQDPSFPMGAPFPLEGVRSFDIGLTQEGDQGLRVQIVIKR
jgi:Protein of unknown function (DUF3352)